MQICKLCEGEIPVPEGESVLKICTGCTKRDDLKGEDLAYQQRQKAISKNPKVKVYKAKNVPVVKAEKKKAPKKEAPKVRAKSGPVKKEGKDKKK